MMSVRSKAPSAGPAGLAMPDCTTSSRRTPQRVSSSTTYCATGFEPTGSISLGWLLVRGSSRVPWPATGTTAMSIGMVVWSERSEIPFQPLLLQQIDELLDGALLALVG